MKTFDSLTEREILALAISLEEEDARIYEDFASGIEASYPEQATKFRKMRHDEDRHRHRLLELYKARFGEHVPLIRRQDVRGFVNRRPVWLVRPAGVEDGAKDGGEHGGGNVPFLRSGGAAGDGRGHPAIAGGFGGGRARPCADSRADGAGQD